MRQYKPGNDNRGLIDNGPITDLGGEVTGATVPQTFVRVDWGSLDGPFCAGVWRCESGTFDIDYPFTEHATLLEGEVVITHPSGEVLHLTPGDGFMGTKGERVTWEVRKACVKSFLVLIDVPLA